LYGFKYAARNRFKYLTAGLLKEGLTQSKPDSCLFLRKDCILVVYVDDCLISPNLMMLLAPLSKPYLLHSYCKKRERYVQIKKDANTNVIQFTQPGLIADHSGLSRLNTWNYMSIIGELN
jgi:hypothetical protein